jgi:carbamoyl-phosphate synthase large subunit
MKINILITGGGGVTGRAVARSLRMSEFFRESRLVAVDIFQNEFSLFEGLYNAYYKLPHVDHPMYEQKFFELVKFENPDVVLVMTDKEALYWGDRGNEIKALISPVDFSKIAGNKAHLYQILATHKLVPDFSIFNRHTDDFKKIFQDKFSNQDIWIRCYDEGSSSGKGACKIKDYHDAISWFTLNPQIDNYLIAEILPGGNYACNLLYLNGKLMQYATYERLTYFMSHIAPSGITGNISVGKLINDATVLEQSTNAIKVIQDVTNTKPNGIYTVDLKGDKNNFPMITEINLRHTAATSSFAQGGCNMAAFQVLASLGMEHLIPSEEIQFNSDNRILRDIDGIPVYIENYQKAIQDRLIVL